MANLQPTNQPKQKTKQNKKTNKTHQALKINNEKSAIPPLPLVLYPGISLKTWSLWENEKGKATEGNFKAKFWDKVKKKL